MAKKFLDDMVRGRQIKKSPITKEKVIAVEPPKKLKETKKAPEKINSNFLSGLPPIKHESTVYTYEDGLCETDVAEKKGSKDNKYSLWIVAFVAMVFLFFAFSSIFAKAKVEVYPKIENLPLNNDFSAFKDSNNEEVLPFSLVSLSGEETKLITSAEEKEAEEKAKGKIMIYNNFTTTPQKLAKDTRFVGSNGKIYKTVTEVTIPGLVKADKSKGIKENTPGSIESSVYASESGEEYNTPPIDFKVLGFKGTPKYEAFYGRSKGDITGGLKGKFNFISTEQKAKAENELKEKLQNKLMEKINEEIPEGYVLFKNGTVFRVDDQDMSVVSKDKEVPFVIKGTLYGFLFEEKSLTKKIVETVVSDYDNSEVFIPNIKDLNFSMSIPAGVVSYLNIKDIDFNLTGKPKVVWKVDENKLREALFSKSKKDFNRVLSQFSNIDKANLILNPIWRTTIPAKMKDIKIIINN